MTTEKTNAEYAQIIARTANKVIHTPDAASNRIGGEEYQAWLTIRNTADLLQRFYDPTKAPNLQRNITDYKQSPHTQPVSDPSPHIKEPTS